MAVYREGYKAIEAIKRASRQIYNDACDYGAPTKKGEPICYWLYSYSGREADRRMGCK